MYRIWVLATAFLVIAGCKTAKMPGSNFSSKEFSWDNATVYFMLTDRFYNGDKVARFVYISSVCVVVALLTPISYWCCSISYSGEARGEPTMLQLEGRRGVCVGKLVCSACEGDVDTHT